ADGSFTYQPPAGFTGVVRFSYQADDGQDTSTPVQVEIVINSLQQQRQVVINELHTDPDDETELVEFIELHNRGTEPVDLSYWRLADGIDFLFPAGTSIAPGGYVVVTQDPDDFAEKFSRTALGP